MREERLRKLAKLVKEQRTINIGILQEHLGVSYPTIRRDLALLASRGVLQRVRGGAVTPDGLHAGLDWFYSDQFHPNHHLKARIGRAAAQMVKPKQTVLIEDSTGTTLEVARALLGTLAISVITNSLEIAYLLKAYGKCKSVSLTGGTLINDRYLAGPLATLSLRQFMADIAFVGTVGFSVENGITDVDLAAAEIKRSMLKSARKAVLVADHTKIGHIETVMVEPLQAVHTVITTLEASPTELARMESLGLTVVTC